MAASVDWHRFWLTVFCVVVGLGGVAAGLYGVTRADAPGAVVGLGLGQFMLTLAVFVAVAHRLVGRAGWFYVLGHVGLRALRADGRPTASRRVADNDDLELVLVGGAGRVALAWSAAADCSATSAARHAADS